MKNLFILIGICLLFIIALPFVLILIVGIASVIYAIWIDAWNALFSIFI